MSKKYKSYSKEDKLSLLRDYYQSGLSKNSFCKSRGISSIRLLNTWLKVFVNEKELLSLQSEQANITDMANRSKESYQEENAQLKQRIKELEKALSFSKLETEARDLMITRAEEYFDIPILQCRLNKAYDYAAAHPDTLVITSGGQGRDEWRPEGDAMRDYLIAKGLPADRVLAESGSTSTEENFAFSLTILREHGFDETTPIVYVSNAFHCYRAGKYAALAGFTKATALPAATPLRSVLPCYLREALALLYYWVFKTSASGPMHAMVGLLELNKNFFYK